MNKIESPCVRNCCLNEHDICIGCLRTLEEIKEWGQASEQRKREVLEQIKQRKAKKKGSVQKSVSFQ